MYTYDNASKTVFFQKDCTKCAHSKVCVFLHEMKKLSTQNFMYRMTEYPEGNNVMRTFELSTKCDHYVRKNSILPKPTLESDEEVIRHIIGMENAWIQAQVQQEYPDELDNKFFFFQPELMIDIKNDWFRLVLKTTSKKIGHGTVLYDKEHKISELLEQWKFHEKK